LSGACVSKFKLTRRCMGADEKSIRLALRAGFAEALKRISRFQRNQQSPRGSEKIVEPIEDAQAWVWTKWAGADHRQDVERGSKWLSQSAKPTEGCSALGDISDGTRSCLRASPPSSEASSGNANVARHAPGHRPVNRCTPVNRSRDEARMQRGLVAPLVPKGIGMGSAPTSDRTSGCQLHLGMKIPACWRQSAGVVTPSPRKMKPRRKRLQHRNFTVAVENWRDVPRKVLCRASSALDDSGRLANPIPDSSQCIAARGFWQASKRRAATSTRVTEARGRGNARWSRARRGGHRLALAWTDQSPDQMRPELLSR